MPATPLMYFAGDLWDLVPLVRPVDWTGQPMVPCARCGKLASYDCSGLWACYDCCTLTEADGTEHLPAPPTYDPTSTSQHDIARERAHYIAADRDHQDMKRDNHYGYL